MVLLALVGGRRKPPWHKVKAGGEIMIHLNISGYGTNRKWECEKAEKEMDETEQRKIMSQGRRGMPSKEM